MGLGPRVDEGRVMRELWQTHNKKFRYLAASLWNTLFGYLAFIALYHLGNLFQLHYLFALAASQFLGIANAYLGYKHFVFKTQGEYLREYFKFSGVYWVVFLVNLFLLPLIVGWVHIGPVLAQALILPAAIIASYVIHSRFSSKPSSPENLAKLRGAPRNFSAHGTLRHILWVRLSKMIQIYRKAGFSELWCILKKKSKNLNWPLETSLSPFGNSYKRWICKHEPCPAQLKREREESRQWGRQPLISILLPTDGDGDLLSDAVKAIESQVYERWEIIKTDAAHLDQALETARGEFIVILSQGGILAPHALLETVKRLNEKPETEIIYSDEDKISANGSSRFEPHFKPEWSPALMRSCNYLGHFCLIRKSLAQNVGGFENASEDLDHYDFLLRLVEKARYIEHIPQILCHARGVSDTDALLGKKALEGHLKRLGQAGQIEIVGPGFYRVRYAVKGAPKISIIIPSKDKVKVLSACVDSIFQKTTYPHYDISIIDNQSCESDTLRYYKEIRKHPKIRLLSHDKPYNYSAINNFAVPRTDGEFLLFLNNDTEVISPEWLDAMLEHAQQPEIGAVGSLLYYPNGAVQHAGVIIGKGGGAWHVHKYATAGSADYFSRINLIRNFSAVTAACLMTRRKVFNEIHGFDEKYPRAFNDVDFCLRLRERGYLVVYTPYAQLYHHESFSRGSDYTEESFSLLRQALEDFESRWEGILQKGDPYHNPNLNPSGNLV